ncbi:MAG TPA: peptide chain release factor N(5)-glutamine methyltransferase [Chloroflexota bacterium]
MATQGETTTTSELLDVAARTLADAGVEEPRAEARSLMTEVLRVSKAWLLAHPEAVISAEASHAFLDATARRARREPFAYVAGHREFFGLDLEVTPDTLIPRPETELLVELAAAAARGLLDRKRRGLRAVDIGTGSGAVAIALAKLVPELHITAVDASAEALRIAARNARTHRLAARIDFQEGDLLSGVRGPLDLVVANLPYIPSGDIEGLMPEVSRFEPRSALDGGPEGTALIRRAVTEAVGLVEPPAVLLFEIGEGQGSSIASLASEAFPGSEVRVHRDYAGLERIVEVKIGDPRG